MNGINQERDVPPAVEASAVAKHLSQRNPGSAWFTWAPTYPMKPDLINLVFNHLTRDSRFFSKKSKKQVNRALLVVTKNNKVEHIPLLSGNIFVPSDLE